MATVTLSNGVVTIALRNQEVNAARRVLTAAFDNAHGDFKHWLLVLHANWDRIAVKQGNTTTITTNEGDAKQFQDLLGQMREELNADWESLLEDFDNKLHNIFLKPSQQWPRPT